jgi:hypothetical protein
VELRSSCRTKSCKEVKCFTGEDLIACLLPFVVYNCEVLDSFVEWVNSTIAAYKPGNDMAELYIRSGLPSAK